MKKILIGILGFLMLMGGIAVGDGTAQTTYTISGSVIRTFNNAPVSGVIMNGLPGNPKTNDAGNYNATVPSGWSGTVKPEKIGYAIHPASQVYSNVTSSLTMDYEATLLPKAALALINKPTATYYVGEPIMVRLTIQNQGIDIITTQGFTNKDFTLGLRFTDPDENLITANLPTGAVLPTPPPPPVAGEYIEIVPQGWVWSNTFEALDSYTLTKAGNYSVKAKFSMSDYLAYFETAPGSGVFYSPPETGSSGDVESNVVNFTLLPSSAEKLAFGTQPSNTTAGGTISPPVTVQIQDAFGNLVTSSTASITLAIGNNPGGGTLSGTTTVTVVAGVATFSNLSIDKAGTGYTLTASSSGLTGATSSAFNITPYVFTGFFSPVGNLPVLNIVKAGAAIPVKFSLNGNQGLDIFAKGYPTSVKIECSSTAPLGAVEETVTAGASSLSYDPASDQYTYVWKTDKGWSGTCRQLVVKFKDGSEKSANFKFTK